ncbi:hypothetical protein KOR42_16420 [Thalassoglobus neptunius]|uniref:Planctomycete cytochrome C n=1 Tax=Thalassoglobus neptunius TaxID=1938619 RepID=A0A5C5X6J4_9PLAN|nr:DUF1592 domain-containing protein [Thalassoglobus neptunius]TWT58269.1 hypothetical protein KOR42_16420 [Thalassoglobus neptunius]
MGAFRNNLLQPPLRPWSLFVAFWLTFGTFLSSALTLRADERLEQIQGFLNSHCIDCHNSIDMTAGLNLEEITSEYRQSAEWDSTPWEKMVKKLATRQMPPPGVVRPDEVEIESSLAALESILDETAEVFPFLGRTDPVRRLNRTEYQNAIRDLLKIEIDARELLPADQSGHGFDNVTVSELSPVLLSRYITAAERISRLAVGGPMRGPDGLTVRLPADRTQEAHVEGLPLGTRGGTLLNHHFPQSGEYEIQLKLMRDRDERVEGIREEHQLDVLLDRELVHQFTILPPRSSGDGPRTDALVDAHLKKRFHVTAGPHAIGVTFPRKFSSLSEINRQPFEASFNRHRHPRQTPAIYEVSIVGPFAPEGPGDTASRRQIFTAHPTGPEDEEACAKKILSRLMRLAYRRPVTESDLAIPMRFFEERNAADGFEAGIESAIATILVNPHFLFRSIVVPQDVASGEIYPISDLELASQLSFFLWSSLPDDELLTLASDGQLSDPAVLNAQVERMLEDSRSSSLVQNFAAQWLYLRNLDSFRPDRRLFPNFDDNLRKALRRETELHFERVLREDRNVLDLIQTDTTFLNERLAQHYEIPHVFGSHFRPVKVDADTQRGGLLRQGSVLAVTSYATRTSPTIRGSWILENLIGTPPPPPPPNIPSLKEETKDAAVTVRERLAEHRANPACASCHDLIDPIGFALEHFDAVGRWREFDQGEEIDTSGLFADGQPISGIDDLERHLVSNPEIFVGTLTEKLMTFALGRGIEFRDAPEIRKIVRSAADHEYQFSSIIKGIVLSKPFQMRTAE